MERKDQAVQAAGYIITVGIFGLQKNVTKGQQVVSFGTLENRTSISIGTGNWNFSDKNSTDEEFISSFRIIRNHSEIYRILRNSIIF